MASLSENVDGLLQDIATGLQLQKMNEKKVMLKFEPTTVRTLKL